MEVLSGHPSATPSSLVPTLHRGAPVPLADPLPPTSGSSLVSIPVESPHRKFSSSMPAFLSPRPRPHRPVHAPPIPTCSSTLLLLLIPSPHSPTPVPSPHARPVPTGSHLFPPPDVGLIAPQLYGAVKTLQTRLRHGSEMGAAPQAGRALWLEGARRATRQYIMAGKYCESREGDLDILRGGRGHARLGGSQAGRAPNNCFPRRDRVSGTAEPAEAGTRDTENELPRRVAEKWAP